MTAEEKLKNEILSQYKSVRAFAMAHNIPNATVSTIFTRGINQTSVTTMIKICQALNISLDELLEGRVVKVENNVQPTKIEDLFTAFQQQMRNTKELTLDGTVLSESEVEGIIKSVNLVLEIEKGIRME